MSGKSGSRKQFPFRLGIKATIVSALFAPFFATPFVHAQAAPDAPLLGFRYEHTAAQRAREVQFDAAISRGNLRTWLKQLSAKPHHLGSAAGLANAEFIAAQFRSWGFETEIERFYVLFPTPKTRLLELTGPKPFRARLEEPEIKEDGTSGVRADQLPNYNAYSVDGDVTAPLVYVNYGIPKDYEELENRGIDVKGKIVIARYGGSWRGIKPKVAAEHGAVGCLIYSDPRDDGYFQGDVYPKGPFRNPDGAQRGSVADMPVFPGDPLTPGVASTKDAKRLALKDAPTLTKIPVMPISYGDAQPLLESLSGPVAPSEWRGALPITYHMGPSAAKVHLKLAFNWGTVEARNVIARLPGSERPDEWVIRGNHHDAWVFGAEDPLSGAVPLMEEARCVGTLVKAGWRPKRTMVYCLWDGEEPGLLGSTEWVEAHADLLTKNAAVYVNSDSNGRGFLNLGGSHTLQPFANEVAQAVTDPETKGSVGERRRKLALVGTDPDAKSAAQSKGDLPIQALGSGSDYTPFLQHLGIASLNLGYSGESSGGIYHSIYDSFDYYTRFDDPNFDYSVALVQTAGRMMLRLADADVLPFSFTPLADTVDRYGKEIAKLADTMRDETAKENQQIADGTLAALLDPTKPDRVPKPKVAVPYLNFAPLQNAMVHLKESAKGYDAAVRRANNQPLPKFDPKALDTQLMRTERALLLAKGLPRRPWFQHALYAPGFYTGYGVKTLPGIREALEQRQWQEFDIEMTALTQALEALSSQIDAATAMLIRGYGKQ